MSQKNEVTSGQVTSAKELGALLRAFRKSKNLTLERIYNLTKISPRFLSEVERGKETAQIGKVFKALNKIGMEVHIYPRGEGPRPVVRQHKAGEENDK